MKLYDAAASGNCHKARMMLSFLGLEYEKVPISLPAGEQKTPEHLARHPLGKVPVLEDGDVSVWDSQAILVYLARKYDGGGTWLPDDPADLGHVTQWLSFAAKEMWDGPAMARAILKFGRDADLAACQELAHADLTLLNDHLVDYDWLIGGSDPTIADIAVYPYAGLAWEGQIDLDAYPTLRSWFQRIETLPNYVGMEGLPH